MQHLIGIFSKHFPIPRRSRSADSASSACNGNSCRRRKQRDHRRGSSEHPIGQLNILKLRTVENREERWKKDWIWKIWTCSNMGHVSNLFCNRWISLMCLNCQHDLGLQVVVGLERRALQTGAARRAPQEEAGFTPRRRRTRWRLDEEREIPFFPFYNKNYNTFLI